MATYSMNSPFINNDEPVSAIIKPTTAISFMSEGEYLNDRLQTEISWYHTNATLNRNLYQFFKTTEIIIAVTIPFLTGYLKENDEIKYFIGVLGLLVAIISGLLVIYKFHEKWIEYRTTAESLKHEKFMFITRSGPYKSDTSLSNLAERVEYLISKENSNWNQFMDNKERMRIPAAQVHNS